MSDPLQGEEDLQEVQWLVAPHFAQQEAVCASGRQRHPQAGEGHAQLRDELQA